MMQFLCGERASHPLWVKEFRLAQHLGGELYVLGTSCLLGAPWLARIPRQPTLPQAFSGLGCFLVGLTRRPL